MNTQVQAVCLPAIAAVARAIRGIERDKLPDPFVFALVTLQHANNCSDEQRARLIGTALQAWYRHGVAHGSESFHPDLLEPMRQLQVAYNHASAVLAARPREVAA